MYEHRIGKLTAQYENRIATRERATVKKQQTRNEIERLVEDLIQESMASGEFDNLAGKGKPLPNRVDYNPYTDFTTHKINQILVETGFAPEWVQLGKDIREDSEKIRKELQKERQRLGPLPLSKSKVDRWQQFCSKLQNEDVKELNKMINKFNLIVPNMNNQKFLFRLEPEADKIMKTGFDPKLPTEPTKPKVEKESQTVQQPTMMSILFDIFK